MTELPDFSAAPNDCPSCGNVNFTANLRWRPPHYSMSSLPGHVEHRCPRCGWFIATKTYEASAPRTTFRNADAGLPDR